MNKIFVSLLVVFLLVTVKASEGKKENYEFTAETGRLMDILINSLY